MNATSLEVQVNAEMAKNSVLLEHLSLSQVVCSASSVNVTFESAEEYAQAIATWPSSGFILFTNHIGQCDTETERGVYEVSALTFNKDSLTIVASTTKSTLQDHATNVHIVFGSSGALAKRDLTSTVDFSWSGDIVDIKNLVIAADTSVNATLDLSVNITYDVSKTKFSALSIDLDLALSADLDVNASVTGSYSTDLYKYSPASLSISAFSIPGILDVGPILSLSLGVELEVSATADINADLSAQITAGKVHLDFLDGNKTTTSGWTPKYTASADVSAEVTAELNPFVDGTVEIVVSVFDGLVNLSAGIDADATVVNAFSVDGKFDVNSTTGITFPTASGTCVNGSGSIAPLSLKSTPL
jgi:hypothetical protein